jgi:predicted transglutaminase-like cysteine proteinase
VPRVQKVLVAAFMAFFMPAVAYAQQPKLVAGEKVPPVPGWTQFCQDYAPVCDTKPVEKRLMALSPGLLRELEMVNVSINRLIKPRTDLAHWGISNERYVYRYPSGEVFDVDKWDYAEDGYGDCEEYILVKRRKLLELGWHRSALLITFVKHHYDVNGKKSLVGHAVLTVRTTAGDLILDIFTDEIKQWWQTEYQFVKRQSEEDPNVWLALTTPALADAK